MTDSKKERVWIAQRCSICRSTILIRATSRKEAQEKLDNGYGENITAHYYDIGPAKVIREDK